MKNVDINIEGTMLTIRVDLSKEFGPSSSVNNNHCDHGRNITIPGRDEKIGLTFIKE